MAKKINVLVLFCCLVAGSLNAQWQTSGSNVYITSGNVGVGVNNPASKFVLQDNYGTMSLCGGAIGFNRSVATGDIFNSSRPGWQFSDFGDRFTLEGYNGAPFTLISVSKNGFVGIGIQYPKYKLDVSGSAYAEQFLVNQDISGVGFNLSDAFTYENKKVGHYSLGWYHDPWNNTGNTLWLSGYAGMKFFTGGRARLTIIENGNVGINTTNPTAMFTVAGEVKAREVKVEVNAGADFVFDEAYALRPLSEVERFISQHKRLPDIAPAQHMEQEGVNIGELQVLLLQKIEELTLYVIEQNKKIETQEKRIAELEGKN